jgi:hypothetical protein
MLTVTVNLIGKFKAFRYVWDLLFVIRFQIFLFQLNFLTIMLTRIRRPLIYQTIYLKTYYFFN